jgi:hypothetical protein
MSREILGQSGFETIDRVQSGRSWFRIVDGRHVVPTANEIAYRDGRTRRSRGPDFELSFAGEIGAHPVRHACQQSWRSTTAVCPSESVAERPEAIAYTGFLVSGKTITQPRRIGPRLMNASSITGHRAASPRRRGSLSPAAPTVTASNHGAAPWPTSQDDARDRDGDRPANPTRRLTPLAGTATSAPVTMTRGRHDQRARRSPRPRGRRSSDALVLTAPTPTTRTAAGSRVLPPRRSRVELGRPDVAACPVQRARRVRQPGRGQRRRPHADCAQRGGRQ